MYIYSVQTYAHGCVIDLQGDQTGDDVEMEKYFLKQYRIIKLLGKGSFGNIKLVMRMSEDCCGGKEELFAMKPVPKAGFSEYTHSSRNVQKEVFSHVIGHPFLIQLYSYFLT